MKPTEVIVAQALIWPSVIGSRRAEGPVGFLQG